MAKTRKLFAWSAGGLDVSTTELKDLQSLEGEVSKLLPADEMYYKDMRQMLESRGYSVRTKISGVGKTKKAKWLSVKHDELRLLYDRHRDSVMAANERLQFERNAEQQNGPLIQNAPEVGIFWWQDESGHKLLSDNNVMGLQTACVIGGLQPVLYSYERPDNLPAGVTWADAKDVMPAAECESYKAKLHAVACIADLGRLRGMKKAIAEGHTYVWFCDLDVQWCCHVKTACSELRAASFQHMVGSMEAARGCRGGKLMAFRNSQFKFLTKPYDNLYPATPFRVTSRTPLLDALIPEVESSLANEGSGYLGFMKLLQSKILHCGLLGAYQSPQVFSGIPYWTKNTCLHARVLSDGTNLDQIMKKAVGINSFWQSGKGALDSAGHSSPLFARGSHERVQPCSLWGELIVRLKEMMSSRAKQQGVSSKRSIVNEPGLQPECSGRRRLRGKMNDPVGPVQQPLPWQGVELAPGSAVDLFRSHEAEKNAMSVWHTCDIRRRCELIRPLGEGTYGEVYEAKYIGESETVAIKVSRGTRLHNPVTATEVALLARAQGHDNVINLRDHFYSPYFVVIVLGVWEDDVWHTLKRRSPTGGLQPATAIHITRMSSRGVAHLHDLNIIHRDLHSKNILLRFARGLQADCAMRPHDVKQVCVTDLGQSCDAHGDKSFIARSLGRGAHVILPPECVLVDIKHIDSSAYDKPIDIWALGVNLVIMVLGVRADFPRPSARTEWLGFWESVLGNWSEHVARRLGWNVGAFTTKHDHTVRGSKCGLDPVAGGGRVQIHKKFMKWDPHVRPVARELDTMLAVGK